MTPSDSNSTLPLSHLKVLEMGQLIAGPFCAKTLADFGAQVIKLEPPEGGDPLRNWRVMRNEEFLVPMGITPHALALAIHVPAPRINDIVRERRAVTADTAMRLARFFGMSAEFWMGLQSDFEVALAKKSLATDLESIQPFKRVATA